jgi:hypothetical protein
MITFTTIRNRAARAVLGATVALSLLAFASPAHAQRLCATPVPTRAGLLSIEVTHGPVSCRDASGVLRRYFDAPRSACGGSHCYMPVGRWWCIAGGIDDPQVASCRRGRRTIRAYLADL